MTYPGYVLDVSLVKGNRECFETGCWGVGGGGGVGRSECCSFHFFFSRQHVVPLEMDAMSGKGYVGGVHKNLYAAAAPVCCLCRLQDL